jgi:hypothetical protein
MKSSMELSKSRLEAAFAFSLSPGFSPLAQTKLPLTNYSLCYPAFLLLFVYQ